MPGFHAIARGCAGVIALMVMTASGSPGVEAVSVMVPVAMATDRTMTRASLQ